MSYSENCADADPMKNTSKRPLRRSFICFCSNIQIVAASVSFFNARVISELFFGLHFRLRTLYQFEIYDSPKEYYVFHKLVNADRKQ